MSSYFDNKEHLPPPSNLEWIGGQHSVSADRKTITSASTVASAHVNSVFVLPDSGKYCWGFKWVAGTALQNFILGISEIGAAISGSGMFVGGHSDSVGFNLNDASDNAVVYDGGVTRSLTLGDSPAVGDFGLFCVDLATGDCWAALVKGNLTTHWADGSVAGVGSAPANYTPSVKLQLPAFTLNDINPTSRQMLTIFDADDFPIAAPAEFEFLFDSSASSGGGSGSGSGGHATIRRPGIV